MSAQPSPAADDLLTIHQAAVVLPIQPTTMSSTARQELQRLVNQFSDEQVAAFLAYARWLLAEEPLTSPVAPLAAMAALAPRAHAAERKTLRQLRQERGWLQRDLAEHLGAPVVTVSSWERGLKTPRPHNLLRLARLFGISPTAIALA